MAIRRIFRSSVRSRATASGSCADGRQRSWELGAPSDDNPGLEETDQEQLIHVTAKNVLERERGQESASHRRWAKNILNPPLDPAAKLLNLVRRYCDLTVGTGERTYRRPSRRNGDARLVLPSHASPLPRYGHRRHFGLDGRSRLGLGAWYDPQSLELVPHPGWHPRRHRRLARPDEATLSVRPETHRNDGWRRHEPDDESLPFQTSCRWRFGTQPLWRGGWRWPGGLVGGGLTSLDYAERSLLTDPGWVGCFQKSPRRGIDPPSVRLDLLGVIAPLGPTTESFSHSPIARRTPAPFASKVLAKGV